MSAQWASDTGVRCVKCGKPAPVMHVLDGDTICKACISKVTLSSPLPRPFTPGAA